jgi:hypothetical protein
MLVDGQHGLLSMKSASKARERPVGTSGVDGVRRLKDLGILKDGCRFDAIVGWAIKFYVFDPSDPSDPSKELWPVHRMIATSASTRKQVTVRKQNQALQLIWDYLRVYEL